MGGGYIQCLAKESRPLSNSLIVLNYKWYVEF